MPINKIIWLFYLPPIAIILVNVAGDRNLFEHGGTIEAFGQSFIAAFTAGIYSFALKILQNVHLSDSAKIKTHNEQLKLLSNTTNAIALGVFAFALIDTIRDHRLSVFNSAVCLFLVSLFIVLRKKFSLVS